MRKRVRVAIHALSFAAVSLIGFAIWIYISDPIFDKAIFFDEPWTKTETGYFATTTAGRSGEVCACPAYECENAAEATTVAFPSLFRRHFQIIREPDAGRDSFDWGRWVGTSVHCIWKDRGQTTHFALQIDKSPPLILQLQ